MDQRLRTLITTDLMLVYMFASLDMREVQALPQGSKESNDKIKEIFEKHAATLVDALAAGGYTIVPKDQVEIPEAFKNM